MFYGVFKKKKRLTNDIEMSSDKLDPKTDLVAHSFEEQRKKLLYRPNEYIFDLTSNTFVQS